MRSDADGSGSMRLHTFCSARREMAFAPLLSWLLLFCSFAELAFALFFQVALSSNTKYSFFLSCIIKYQLSIPDLSMNSFTTSTTMWHKRLQCKQFLKCFSYNCFEILLRFCLVVIRGNPLFSLIAEGRKYFLATISVF